MSANQTKYPQLRFKGFTDPWEQRKLGDLGLNISDGDWIEKQHIFENGQYRIIQTGNIGVDEYLDKPQNAKYFRQEDFNQLKANEIFPGDIVVCRLADPAGRAVILPNIGKQMVTSVDVAILRPSSRISFRFLVSQLNNPRNLKQVQIMASGSTRTRISRKNLEREIIQLPNINEQKKIGSFFSILNSTIALHQRKLTKLKELKQGYLQKMFPKNGSKFPQLRFAGFADAWEQRKLGELGSTFTGLTGKTKEDFGHGDAKFVTYMNVFQNAVASLEQLDSVEIDPKQNEVKKGDVFFTTSSETPEEVGMSSVWKYNYDNVYLNSFTFGYRPNIEFDLDYLAAMLRSTTVRKKITFLAQGISRYNISKTKMMDIEVPVPSLEEQAKIGAFLSNVEQTITLHQRKLEKLQELKKGYLQKMFC